MLLPQQRIRPGLWFWRSACMLSSVTRSPMCTCAQDCNMLACVDIPCNDTTAIHWDIQRQTPGVIFATCTSPPLCVLKGCMPRVAGWLGGWVSVGVGDVTSHIDASRWTVSLVPNSKVLVNGADFMTARHFNRCMSSCIAWHVCLASWRSVTSRRRTFLRSSSWLVHIESHRSQTMTDSSVLVGDSQHGSEVINNTDRSMIVLTRNG